MNVFFRKKPVVISAIQFTPSVPRSVEETPAWYLNACLNGSIHFQGGDAPYATIETLEGNMRADAGDWIIYGIKGEIYPCKPDIFDATYEAA